MTRQEIFDRGVIGTIAQGFIYNSGGYADEYGEICTGEPRRCFLGHSSDLPIGTLEVDPPRTARFGETRFNALVATVSGLAPGLADFRRLMSELALEYGLDDSCCWWEVADA